MAQVQAKAEPVKFGDQMVPEERKAPMIRPQDVVLNWSGNTTKSVIVTAPEGFSLSDLNEHPEIWKQVQTDRSGRGIILGEDDEIVIRAGTKRIRCFVNYADSSGVIVYGVTQADKPVRNVALPQDANYETRPVREGGYAGFRKADGVRITVGSHSTPDACWMAVQREQYPARL